MAQRLLSLDEMQLSSLLHWHYLYDLQETSYGASFVLLPIN
jgi:hypothetical protein